MKRLKRWWGEVFDALRLVDHRILNAVRGRGIHLLLTGTDRDALHSLVDLVSQASGLRVPPHPTRAQDTQNDPRKVAVSWGLDDLTDLQSVRESVGRFRKVLVVVATADPRDSVCARDRSVPHQPMDSADYSIEGIQRSLTAPGVLPRFRALDEVRQKTPRDLLEVAQSDLRNPSQVLSSLADLLESSGKRLRTSRVVGSEHLTDSRPNWFESTKSIGRVASQIRLHPELEERATSEGYPTAPELVDKNQLTHRLKRGKIIAFHTPDDIYRAEALRLKQSLESLGLDFEVFEVDASDNWVRTTLLKPSWILPIREKLRGPILYIDVDAFVHSDPWPHLQDIDGDLAAVVYRTGQLNSATIWIADTEGAQEILRRWKDSAFSRRDGDDGTLQATGDNGDQGVLKLEVLAAENSGEQSFRFVRLPPNLAFIFDRGDEYLYGKPVIEQLQVSRESAGHEKRLARRRERLKELDSGP